MAPSRRVRRRVEKDRTAILEDRLAQMESLLQDRRNLVPPANSSPAMSFNVADAGLSSNGTHVPPTVQRTDPNLEAGVTLAHSRILDRVNSHGASASFAESWKTSEVPSNRATVQSTLEQVPANERNGSAHENEEISISPQQVRFLVACFALSADEVSV